MTACVSTKSSAVQVVGSTIDLPMSWLRCGWLFVWAFRAVLQAVEESRGRPDEPGSAVGEAS